MGWLIAFIYCVMATLGGYIMIFQPEIPNDSISQRVFLIVALVILVILDVVFYKKYRNWKMRTDAKKMKPCSVCNENKSNIKLKDGYICEKCIENCYPFLKMRVWKSITSENAKRAIEASEENKKLQAIYKSTKIVAECAGFDEKNKLWKVRDCDVVFTYDEIIGYELLQDGQTVTKGGLGRAVVGGALFGSTGAIVGGVTGTRVTTAQIHEFRLKIVTRKEMYPQVYINFLQYGPVEAGSFL